MERLKQNIKVNKWFLALLLTSWLFAPVQQPVTAQEPDDEPVFETAILETPFPSHRFHAIGVGEVAPAPGPSAVLMAVYNATGQRIMSYPLTPEKILKALGKA